MLSKWRQYSYAAQKKQKHRILGFVFWLLTVLICFSLISSYLVFTVEVKNESMSPLLLPKDRVAVTTLAWSPLGRLIFKGRAQVSRGELLLIRQRNEEASLALRVFDAPLRFFSGQHVAINSLNSRFTIRRLIGLPQDSVYMENFVYHIKKHGESWHLTEFEQSTVAYDIDIPPIPADWGAEFPLSSAMGERLLGQNEVFVGADMRSGPGDSRVWQPIELDDIGGKVFFRYWPLSRFGFVR